MQWFWHEAQTWLGLHGKLLVPLLIAVWISWGDLKTRRIPNYLTFSAALAGLACNLALSGWHGLVDGFLGLLLGFGFLILPYILGGMGAGDVKALAALGAWLGPTGTLYLFCYMGVAGGLMSLAVMIWHGILWQKIRRVWTFLLNLILSWGSRTTEIKTQAPAKEAPVGIPYGVAMALGMAVLVVTG